VTDNARRNFIAGSAALAAAPFIASIGNAQAPQRKLGVALVGLGSLSEKQIAPALLKTRNCRLAGIVTGTPSKAADWQKKYSEEQGHRHRLRGHAECAAPAARGRGRRGGQTRVL
jgi:hypothetical protein